MNTSLRRIAVAVTSLLAGVACSASSEPPTDPQPTTEQVEHVAQPMTGCELDCPNGSVFTCSGTCSVVPNTSITCNGTTTQCPSCVPQTCDQLGVFCGTTVNNCGQTVNCGGCPSTRPVCHTTKCCNSSGTSCIF